jgi:hypothetical protein
MTYKVKQNFSASSQVFWPLPTKALEATVTAVQGSNSKQHVLNTTDENLLERNGRRKIQNET